MRRILFVLIFMLPSFAFGDEDGASSPYVLDTLRKTPLRLIQKSKIWGRQYYYWRMKMFIRRLCLCAGLCCLFATLPTEAYADNHQKQLKVSQSSTKKANTAQKGGIIDYRRCRPGVPCGTGCCPHGMRCGDSKCHGRSNTEVKDPVSPEQLKSMR